MEQAVDSRARHLVKRILYGMFDVRSAWRTAEDNNRQVIFRT